MKIPPEPPSQLIIGRALGLYPEPVFVIVKPVTAETVAVNEPAEPPSPVSSDFSGKLDFYAR